MFVNVFFFNFAGLIFVTIISEVGTDRAGIMPIMPICLTSITNEAPATSTLKKNVNAAKNELDSLQRVSYY